MKPFILLLLLTATPLFAQTELTVASFNLAWAGTEEDFKEHVRVCSQVQWCDTRPRDDSPAALQAAQSCESKFIQSAGGDEKALNVAPCNAYQLRRVKGKITTALYQEKMRSLAATIDGLITTEGVNLFAFQEVKSERAIQSLFAVHQKDFAFCVAKHSAFQTLGFAWKKDITAAPVLCQTKQELAVLDNAKSVNKLRKVRPGLAMNLTINGQKLALLNVHLKAGCANLIDSQRYPGRLLNDDEPACRTYNRQVSILENWIDETAVQTPNMIVLGDFNRRIDEELEAKPAKVRSDGKDPTTPNTPDAQGQVTSMYLWQEVFDGKPVAFHQVPLSSSSKDCKGFIGLDHILVSESIKLKQTQLSSKKLANVQAQGQQISTSDHCPRIVRLKI